MSHLRKEEMKSTPKGSVSVGATVVIESLEISDAQAVATVKAAQADNRDLVEYITRSVEIGVRALQASGVNVGIEQLAEGIADAEKAMGKVGKELAVNLNEKLEAIAGDQGSLTKGIQESLDAFAKELEKITGGENSPIREGIKKQLDAVSKALTENFTRTTVNQKDEIAKMLDIENAQSPLRGMAQSLTTLGESVVRIQTTLDEAKGRAVEAVKGTRKGGTYETSAIAAVSEIARASSDEPLATGGTPGKGGTAKKGDGVIRLREGLTVKANLVVEAKDMSSRKTDLARLKYWSDQAEGARKTRGAIGFLGLCKNLSDMPGGARIVALDKLGQNLVLAYDPDNNEDEMLALVYQVVKMHCLSIVSTGVEINPAAMNSYVESSLAILERFDAIDGAVGKIKTQADSIRTVSEGIKDDLTSHLRSMRREIAGAVQQITIDNNNPLELPALDDDSDPEFLGINIDFDQPEEENK
jgi:predicted  nucleic acid-binding Zn-ribbon protein